MLDKFEVTKLDTVGTKWMKLSLAQTIFQMLSLLLKVAITF